MPTCLRPKRTGRSRRRGRGHDHLGAGYARGRFAGQSGEHRRADVQPAGRAAAHVVAARGHRSARADHRRRQRVDRREQRVGRSASSARAHHSIAAQRRRGVGAMRACMHARHATSPSATTTPGGGPSRSNAPRRCSMRTRSSPPLPRACWWASMAAKIRPMHAMAASPFPNTLGVRGSELVGLLGGACMMRRAAFLEAGGYHPRLFLGREEALLAVDLLTAGWHMAYIPGVVVHHHPSRLRDIRGTAAAGSRATRSGSRGCVGPRQAHGAQHGAGGRKAGATGRCCAMRWTRFVAHRGCCASGAWCPPMSKRRCGRSMPCRRRTRRQSASQRCAGRCARAATILRTLHSQ